MADNFWDKIWNTLRGAPKISRSSSIIGKPANYPRPLRAEAGRKNAQGIRDSWNRPKEKAPVDLSAIAKTMSNILSAGTASGQRRSSGSGSGRSITEPSSRSSGPAMDPESILARLQKQFPAYKYGGPSGSSMAKREFAPQFEMLSQLMSQQKGRYKQGDRDLSGMYDALARDLRQTVESNQKGYKEGTSQINRNTAGASKNIAAAFGSSQKELGGILKMLGQGEAAPALFKDSQRSMGKEVGYVNTQGAGAANLNTSLGANARAYDNRQVGLSRQAGIEHRGDLMNDYINQQNENDLRKLDLTGQQQSAANKYDMSIQGLIQQGAQGRQEGILDMLKNTLGYNQNQAKNQLARGDQSIRLGDQELKRAGLDLGSARLKMQADQFNTTEGRLRGESAQRQLNPYDKLVQSASRQMSPQAANSLAAAVLKVYRENPGQKSIAELIKQLMQAPEMRQFGPSAQGLAAEYYKNLV